MHPTSASGAHIGIEEKASSELIHSSCEGLVDMVQS
jgi:hypothetical protein